MKALYAELVRQFGKEDAEVFALAPHRYRHHFDARTLDAYNQIGKRP